MKEIMELENRIRKFTFETSHYKKNFQTISLVIKNIQSDQYTFFSHPFINNHSLNLITKDEDDNKIRGQ